MRGLVFTCSCKTLDEEKNGYVARDQVLYALWGRAGLMPEVTDLAAAWGHEGTRTNQGSCIIHITEKPYQQHQLSRHRDQILGY